MQTKTNVHFKTLIKLSLSTFTSYNAVYSLSLTRYNHGELTYCKTIYQQSSEMTGKVGESS